MDALVLLVGAMLSRLHDLVGVDVCPGGWAWSVTALGALLGLVPTAGAFVVALLRRPSGSRYQTEPGAPVAAIALVSCGLAPWMAFAGTGELFRRTGAASGLSRAERLSLAQETCFGVTERAYLGSVPVSEALGDGVARTALFAGPLVFFPVVVAAMVWGQGRLAMRRGPRGYARLFGLPVLGVAALTAGLPAGATAQLWTGMLAGSVAGLFGMTLVPPPARSAARVPAPRTVVPRPLGRAVAPPPPPVVGAAGRREPPLRAAELHARARSWLEGAPDRLRGRLAGTAGPVRLDGRPRSTARRMGGSVGWAKAAGRANGAVVPPGRTGRPSEEGGAGQARPAVPNGASRARPAGPDEVGQVRAGSDPPAWPDGAGPVRPAASGNGAGPVRPAASGNGGGPGNGLGLVKPSGAGNGVGPVVAAGAAGAAGLAKAAALAMAAGLVTAAKALWRATSVPRPTDAALPATAVPPLMPEPRLPATLVGPPNGVEGRFELIRGLGAGGFGGVWLAHDHIRGHRVALKAAHAPDPVAEVRIRREARALSAVRHPNCVRIFDLVDSRTDAGLRGLHGLVIVMEHLDGGSLAELVARRGPLDDATVGRAWLLLAGALAAAHDQGVLHRDVKPGNVLVDPAGEPHLIDFGIARARGDATLTQHGFVLGTPDYLAPEVARGGPASTASDSWQLAATMSFALTGWPPRGGGHEDPMAGLRAAASDAPLSHLPTGSAHRDLLRASLAADPGVRPTLAVLRDTLDRWLVRSGADPRRASTAPRPY